MELFLLGGEARLPRVWVRPPKRNCQNQNGKQIENKGNFSQAKGKCSPQKTKFTRTFVTAREVLGEDVWGKRNEKPTSRASCLLTASVALDTISFAGDRNQMAVRGGRVPGCPTENAAAAYPERTSFTRALWFRTIRVAASKAAVVPMPVPGLGVMRAVYDGPMCSRP